VDLVPPSASYDHTAQKAGSVSRADPPIKSGVGAFLEKRRRVVLVSSLA
jgi:hypothetical protein